MNGYGRVTLKVYDYHRLNNEQLERQLETQKVRLRAIDTSIITESETDTLFEICLAIHEIKKVLKHRDPKPSPFAN